MRAADGELVLVARDAERLKRAADELNPLSTAAFDAQDTDRLERFLGELPGQVDHMMVTAGSPSYTPIAELDLAEAGHDFGGRIALMLAVARASREKIRAGGTLLFIGGTGGRRPAAGMAVMGALTAALPALTCAVQKLVAAGQAAYLYSLIRPPRTRVRSSRRGVLESASAATWRSQRGGRCSRA